jgi:RNA polymerase sigma-32 factor
VPKTVPKTAPKAPAKKTATVKKRSASKTTGAPKKSTSRKPAPSAKSAKTVEAELVDDLEQELPPLDAAIDIDPDRDINEEEFTPNKIRTVNAVLVDSPSTDTESSKALTSSSMDPVAMYLAEIRKYPLLSREQEQELALRYREHADSKAAEMLVTANLRFVVKVVFSIRC